MPQLTTPTIVPNLWFDTEAEDAAALYCSIFPGSRVVDVHHYGPAGPGPEGTVMLVVFELGGMRFTAINGGPQFPFTEAVSLEIVCRDQEEVDHYWDALLDGGGEESRCGWLRDRFGLSWQVVPEGMGRILGDPDPARAQRAVEAMLGMRKLDLAALEAAAAG
jgi:predicted 3-demethylubiquinone-9 3-methyltransferase (glyoxalase superfamily)